jgi:hypothetical protein
MTVILGFPYAGEKPGVSKRIDEKPSRSVLSAMRGKEREAEEAGITDS